MPKELTEEERRNLAYWENLTPEQNAKICAGLRKGFEDHYWKLRDRPPPWAAHIRNEAQDAPRVRSQDGKNREITPVTSLTGVIHTVYNF